MEDNEIIKLFQNTEFVEKVVGIAKKQLQEDEKKKTRGPRDETRASELAHAMQKFCTPFKGSDGAMYVHVHHPKYSAYAGIVALNDVGPTEATFAGLISEIIKADTGKFTKPSIIHTACAMFVESARVHAHTVETAIRKAHTGKDGSLTVYLDRGVEDVDKCYIRVAGDGVSVSKDSGGFYFLTEGSDGVLPEPDYTSTFSTLPPWLALNAEDKKAAFLWCLQTLLPMGAYVNLALDAQAGAGKSTVVAYLRNITDPQAAFFSEGGLPEKPIDFMVTASRTHIVSYDNIEDIPRWFNAVACRVSRGAFMSVKTLFTTTGRTKITTKNPLIFSGINLVREMRSDLIRRSLILKVPERIRNSNSTESLLERQFHEMHPQLLGAVLNALSGAIRHIDKIRETDHGSMPEFRRWSIAAGIELGWSEEEINALIDKYQDPKRDSDPLESAPFLKLVVELLESSPNHTYHGTPGYLLRTLRGVYMDASESTEFPVDFPVDETRCAMVLRNARAILSKYNIIVIPNTDHTVDGNRVFMQLVKAPEDIALENQYKINAMGS